jgi:hypothetical protein
MRRRDFIAGVAVSTSVLVKQAIGQADRQSESGLR